MLSPCQHPHHLRQLCPQAAASPCQSLIPPWSRVSAQERCNDETLWTSYGSQVQQGFVRSLRKVPQLLCLHVTTCQALHPPGNICSWAPRGWTWSTAAEIQQQTDKCAASHWPQGKDALIWIGAAGFWRTTISRISWEVCLFGIGLEKIQRCFSPAAKQRAPSSRIFWHCSLVESPVAAWHQCFL